MVSRECNVDCLRIVKSFIECPFCGCGDFARSVLSAYGCQRMNAEESDNEWKAQCRRQLERPTLDRIKYGFAWVHKPVLDDGASRAFDSMADYRQWCHENLPPYLGYRLASTDHACE